MQRILLIGLYGLLLASTACARNDGGFDFYVLSLSWSPEFCVTKPENRQCGRGYGFVLHGLWPQYNKGYPDSCSSEKMPGNMLQAYAGLYPDTGLAFHEWKKHGTCSGLTPEGYLQLSQSLKNKFETPSDIRDLTQPLRVSTSDLKAKIIAANPVLTDAAIAVNCSGGGRFLQEVYLCYDKTGQSATACSTEMQRRSAKSCGQENFLIRSVR